MPISIDNNDGDDKTMNIPAQEAKDATGNLQQALQHAHALLSQGGFDAAEEQGLEILKTFPDNPNAMIVVATAQRQQGKAKDALPTLIKLVKRAQDFPMAHFELGLVYELLDNPEKAIVSFKNVIDLQPENSPAWQKLSELYQVIGNETKSKEATDEFFKLSNEHPRLIEAASCLRSDDLAKTESLCREHIHEFPRDVNAIRILAEVAIRMEVYDDAQGLLERVLKIAPDFHLARLNLAHVLNKRERSQEALDEIVTLEQANQSLQGVATEKAAILSRIGRHEEAIELYQAQIKMPPTRSKLYSSLGHALRAVGRREEAIAAYHQAMEVNATDGESYWRLADLKNYHFRDAEIRSMSTILATAKPLERDEAQIQFSLGKALEDRGLHDESFSAYQRGNALKHKLEPYSAKNNSNAAGRSIKHYTQDYFSNRQGLGCERADPIFIVSLPRSGSTLLEQILASHSLVEGTKELPDIISMTRRLSRKRSADGSPAYPAIMAQASPDDLRALGEEYLQRAAIQRSGSPFFIDKMPNNFAHIGFIKSILPNAKIIDARRHPMASCFSCFKQHFANGQTFTYDQSDIGHYYADYMRLMNHWHQTLPGEVLTVHYEAVVTDFETQVRRLLEFCGLPFEEACLNFYDNKRSVRTASSEQVRQPIYTSGLDAWQSYEEHLTPLKEALGECLDEYPY